MFNKTLLLFIKSNTSLSPHISTSKHSFTVSTPLQDRQILPQSTKKHVKYYLLASVIPVYHTKYFSIVDKISFNREHC